MSKVTKAIGKGLKKIGKVVKKIAPYVLMAVAAYFTAGVALSYFGATAGFAASMPGFGATGLFTKAATAIGLSGPASAAAAAGSTAVAATTTAAGTAVTTSSLANMGGTIAGGTAGANATAVASSVAQTGSYGVLKAGATGATGVAAGATQAVAPIAKAGMSVADKLLIAKTVTDTASGLFADKPRDPMKYYWGKDKNGEGMDLIANQDMMVPRETVVKTPAEYYNETTGDFLPGSEQGRQAIARQDARNTPAADYQRKQDKQPANPGDFV